MNKTRKQAAGSAPLRPRAKKELKKREHRAPSRADEDLRDLVRELQVHQLELQMQYEELQVTRSNLESALERYTELFDFAPIGYACLTEDGTIKELNLACEQLLASVRARLLGQRFALCITVTDRVAFADFLAQAVATAGEVTTACEVTLAGTGRRVVHLTATTLQGPESRILVAMQDITDRRRAEEELREAARRKDEFLAALSHELRNPLTPIRNSVALLDCGNLSSEKARQARAIITRQVAHLSRIVEDLLDVTRIARGKVHLHRERIDLRDVARHAIDDYRADFEARRVGLGCRLGEEPFWVDGDRTRLSQVIGNLLANAAKFIADEDRVDVTLHREGSKAVLRVCDTGPGFAPEVLGHLFEPFVQAPQSLDRAGGGLGLGLATVKGLVELHNGSVGVTRVQPGGRGAEIEIRLPLAAPPESVPAAADRGVPKCRRVLVIEDNGDAAESLRALLEIRGQNVRVAFDGPTALVLAREFRPEIVLCDIGLPGMDGYAVARAMQADPALNRPYLVALTGYAQSEDAQRATDAGFAEHVAKPPSLETLEKVLSSAPALRGIDAA